MKPLIGPLEPQRRAGKSGAAYTLIEVVVITGVVLILGGLGLVTLAKHKVHSERGRCTTNLKNIGLAFRTWAADNQGALPMSVSTNRGGTQEYIGTGEVFRHYQVLLQELSSPQVLICPVGMGARTQAATNWEVLANRNLDYFVGLDATGTFSSFLLAGDRWLTSNVAVTNHLLVLGTNATLAWQSTRHGDAGNVALGDGSVQGFTTRRLQQQLPTGTQAPLRLAIPQ